MSSSEYGTVMVSMRMMQSHIQFHSIALEHVMGSDVTSYEIITRDPDVRDMWRCGIAPVVGDIHVGVDSRTLHVWVVPGCTACLYPGHGRPGVPTGSWYHSVVRCIGSWSVTCK